MKTKQTTTIKTLTGLHTYPNNTKEEVRTFLTTKGMNEVMDEPKKSIDFKFV